MNDANISGLYNPTNFSLVGAKITDLFNKDTAGFDVLNLVFVIVGLLFFVNLVISGWQFMLSSGDPKKAALANTGLTNSLTGIIMVFTAYLVVKVVSTLLGLGSNI